jgi:hypothetical protein
MPPCSRRGDRREQGGITARVAPRAPQYLVGELDQPAPAGMELAAPPHVLRAGGGRDVERARGRRPPIQQQRFVLVRSVVQADPPDIGDLARHRVQPAETQCVVRHVQSLHLSGQRPDLGITVQQRGAVSAQGRVVFPLGPGAFGIEPGVELVHVGLFGVQLVFVSPVRHMPSLRSTIAAVVAAAGCVPRLATGRFCGITRALPQGPRCAID